MTRANTTRSCQSGENVTAGLMALRLQEMDVPARSWQGWQVPINTTSAHGAARFVSIPRDNIDAKFAEGFKVAVVAGFQGVSPEGRITTLGRGGSDTTAVAFAAAFGAERCDIYTDVDGVYTTDPRITAKARKLDKIAFEEMLELASLGAKVLQTRSVELAMRYKVRLRVLSSFRRHRRNLRNPGLRRGGNRGKESRIRRRLFARRSQDDPGEGRRPPRHRRRDLRPAGRGRGERRHDRAEHLGAGPCGHSRAVTDMTFSCPTNQVERARKAMEDARGAGNIAYDDLVSDTDVAKISVVGIGMRSHVGRRGPDVRGAGG